MYGEEVLRIMEWNGRKEWNGEDLVRKNSQVKGNVRDSRIGGKGTEGDWIVGA